MALDDLKLEEIEGYKEPPAGLVTFEEFLEWCEDKTHAEWVDGRVILLDVTVQERHDAIRGFLYWLMFTVAELTGRGVVDGEPFLMHLPGLNQGRMPDVFLLLAEHRDRMRKHFLEGPADIVVEVVSPESRRRDRVEKLADYEQAGIPEYWLVDGEARRAEFRVLGPDGRYVVAFAGESGEYQSTVLPTLRLKVDWLWQERGERNGAEILRTLGLG